MTDYAKHIALANTPESNTRAYANDHMAERKVKITTYYDRGETMAKTTYKDWEADEKILLLQGWARNGLTNEQIASNMDIVVSTLWEWRKKSPKISNALKIGKDEADIQVENALYKAALEGNTTAMIFWLKNRRSKEWRDKIQQEITTESAVKLVIDNNELSDTDE